MRRAPDRILEINGPDYCRPSADHRIFTIEGKRNPNSTFNTNSQEEQPEYKADFRPYLMNRNTKHNIRLCHFTCLALVLMFIAPGCEKKPTKSLHQAAADGDISQIQLLISRNADVNAKDKDSSTPLHFAARWGHTDVAQLLIGKGADVNATDARRWTPLHFAARFDRTHIAQMLIAESANVNAKATGKWTPLHLAVRFGYTDVAKLLIAKAADIDAKTVEDMTPLLFSILHARQDIENLLIAKAAQPDIFAESIRGDTNAVAAFLKNNPALVNARQGHFTPLHWAAYCGHLNTAKLLLAKGADVNAHSEHASPLYWAVRKNHPDLTRLLIDSGADVNAKNTHGATVLHYAPTTQVVQLLIDRGANVNDKDNYGRTALHVIVSEEAHKGLLKLLIPKDADITAQHPENLHLKAAKGQAAVAKLLIAEGADINAKDITDKTPLQWAKEKGHIEIVKLLRKHGAKE